MVLRQGEGRVHMTLINPDVKRTARVTIHLARRCHLAVDHGIERGFAVPLRDDDRDQEFDIMLASGEGTLITAHGL